MQVTRRFVRTSALNIAYEQTGPDSGRPILLLHGFPYDVREYDGVRDQIAGGDWRIIVPYLRGFGEDDRVTPPLASEGQEHLFTGYYERRVVPKVGHCPPAEKPDEVRRAIEDVLDCPGCVPAIPSEGVRA
jgi:pimeloyl-ACP methyl ester carboxylesterase